MRFNTNFIYFSIFLSLSVAAPIAQYSEEVSAGSPIDSEIDSSSNNFFTGTSSSDIGAYLMAARPLRDDKSRRRPSTQPQTQMRPPIPHPENCVGDPTRPGACQQDELPATSSAPEQQTDIIPDPWLDDPAGTAATAAGALYLWDLLTNPNPASSP